MEDINALNLNELDTDYKAPVLAAELIEAGFDINRLFIWPVGSARRNFSKDVLGVEWYTPESGYHDFLCIKSSREGLYDMLPEGLFHTPVPYASTRSTEEVIDQIRLFKEQEKAARKFFLPLEAEINLFRILIELHENKIDKKNIYDDLIAIFRPAWEIFELLDQQQANIFLHIIPYLHQLKGDLQKLGDLAGLMLQVPVQVSVRTADQYVYTDGSPVLGDCVLGVNMVPGDRFYEGDEEVLITIGPLNAATAMRFYHGTLNDQILRTLTGYFVPADMNIIVAVEIEKTSQALLLDESVLGYTAFI